MTAKELPCRPSFQPNREVSALKLREETDLSAFFDPASVVMAGSLREVPGTAFWVIRNMRHFGYSGKIYAVNPNPDQYGDVLGCPVYSSIEELPGPVDLAAVITPPGTVPGIVRHARKNGSGRLS